MTHVFYQGEAVGIVVDDARGEVKQGGEGDWGGVVIAVHTQGILVKQFVEGLLVGW